MRMTRTRMRKNDSHDDDDNDDNDGNSDNDDNKDNEMTRTTRTWDEDTTIKKRTRMMRDDNDEG